MVVVDVVLLVVVVVDVVVVVVDVDVDVVVVGGDVVVGAVVVVGGSVVGGAVVVTVDVVVVGFGAGLLVAAPSAAAEATQGAVTVANTDTAMTNRRVTPLRDAAIVDLPSFRPPLVDEGGRH